MKRLRIFYAVSLFMGLGMTCPAYADMDYHCLNACIHNGKTPNVCMTQCTYGSAVQLPHVSGNEPLQSPHNQFAAPVPSGSILYKPHSDVLPASKNYSCISGCRKNGFQYQYCDEHCMGSSFSQSPLNSHAPGDKAMEK